MSKYTREQIEEARRRREERLSDFDPESLITERIEQAPPAEPAIPPVVGTPPGGVQGQ